jgi:hypothetical protein
MFPAFSKGRKYWHCGTVKLPQDLSDIVGKIKNTLFQFQAVIGFW